MTRQPVSHRRAVGSKSTERPPTPELSSTVPALAIHSGNGITANCSGGNHYSLCNGLSARHLPTAPPAAPTPCCIPRYRSVGSTFPPHNLRHTSHKTTFSPSPYNPEPSCPADANDGPLSLPGQAGYIAAGFFQRQSSGHVQTTVVVRHCPAEVLTGIHRTHSTKRPVGCASQLLSP